MKLSKLLIALSFLVNTFIIAQDNVGSGNCLDFDGSPEHVLIPSNGAFDFGTGDFTVEFWMRAGMGAADKRLVGRYNGCGTNTGFHFQTERTTGQMVFYLGVRAITSAQNVLDNTWHHIAGVRNGATLTLYVDGVQAAQRSDVGAQNATAASDPSLRFGSSNATPCSGGGGAQLSGNIDEVRIWDHDRTLAEIRDNLVHTLTGSETGLVGYWNLNEGSDNTCSGGQDVCDLSSSGNHGTLH